MHEFELDVRGQARPAQHAPGSVGLTGDVPCRYEGVHPRIDRMQDWGRRGRPTAQTMPIDTPIATTSKPLAGIVVDLNRSSERLRMPQGGSLHALLDTEDELQLESGS
jgi:hypothetical protein